VNLNGFISSSRRIFEALDELFDRIADPALTIRRMYVVANHVITCAEAAERRAERDANQQLSLFADPDTETAAEAQAEAKRAKERSMQQAMLDIKKRYGKNAVLRGMNYEEGATARERNGQVGGHRA
ncbi:MAG: DNA methylase, partial [Clostridia bacterium]|nr:DNA methylase [Clostridia bacterium]